MLILQPENYVWTTTSNAHAHPYMTLDRRDLWFDRAKTERDDVERETRMLNEAMRIIKGHQDFVNLTGRTPKKDT